MTPGAPLPTRKYGLAIAVGALCLYAVAAAWIIGGEGESYRQDLRTRLAAKARDEPPAEVGTTTAIDTAPSTVATPTRTPAIAPAPSTAPPPPTPIVIKTPAPTASAPAPTIASASAPTTTPSSTPGLPPIDPFWEEPTQKKIWDLDHLTVQDEKELGQALHQMVRHCHPFLENGPLPRRLEDAGEAYLKAGVRKDVDYTFTVLDCECSNVFSHPGGYIYVCRGLFDWIAEDEDYALEYAIAHEMAHVDLAHAINCLRDPEVKKLQLGTVPLFYLVVIPWGYKPEQDLEADKWAWERLSKAGRSRYESFAFLRKLEDYSRKNGFENVPKKPNDEPKVPFLDNHIRTHPIPRKRLRELKVMLDPPSAQKT